MGLVRIIFWFITLGVLLFSLMTYWVFYGKYSDIPPIEDGWWGQGNPTKDYDAIVRFNVSVSDDVLIDLKNRLNNWRYTESLEGTAFHYGFNSLKLKEIVTYWRDKYNWRETEKILNKFNHFKTQIEGINVHFIHMAPEKVPPGAHVVPILLLHGWPGSFVEFYRVIPELVKPKPGARFVFEVVCPSIPGFGFSEAPYRPGFGYVQAAILLDKLMAKLGFTSYYIQGGDWGSLIASGIAIFYPHRVSGIHLNMVTSNSLIVVFKKFLGILAPPLIYTKDERSIFFPLENVIRSLLYESGYVLLQSTKPDTIGAGLSDSPAGLAAYILEKFSTWTDRENVNKTDGGLTDRFTMEDLVTNVMIYWVTNTITSSIRFYKENMIDRSKGFTLLGLPVKAPAGLAIFPNEIPFGRLPHSLITDRYPNIVTYTKMPRGGHFAALEEPVLLAKDIWKFVGAVVDNS